MTSSTIDEKFVMFYNHMYGCMLL